MKKFGWLIIILAFLLAGCQDVPTFETIGNAYLSGETPAKRGYTLALPQEAAAQTVSGSAGTIYFCNGYEIMLETMSSGDLNSTLTALSGFDTDDLTLLQRKEQDYTCYESAWTSIGEGGFQTARTKILDDGAWHYCLTVCAPAEEVSALQTDWQTLFDSFGLTQAP